ncbi:MAG: hypothetical protein WCL16_10800, partial [bacterium]
AKAEEEFRQKSWWPKAIPDVECWLPAPVAVTSVRSTLLVRMTHVATEIETILEQLELAHS